MALCLVTTVSGKVYYNPAWITKEINNLHYIRNENLSIQNEIDIYYSQQSLYLKNNRSTTWKQMQHSAPGAYTAQ